MALTTRDKSDEVFTLFKILAELLNKQPIPAIALYTPKELLASFSSMRDENGNPLEITWVAAVRGVKAGIVEVSIKATIKDSTTLGIAFELTHQDTNISPKKNYASLGLVDFVLRLFSLSHDQKITYKELLERTNAAIADYQKFYGITTS